MPNVSLMGWDAANKMWRRVVVNADGKLIIDPSEIFENVPTDNEHGKAPDSDWAYDHQHDNDGVAVHYTDDRAVACFGTRQLTITSGNYTNLNCSNKSILLCDTASGDITLRGISGGIEGQILFVIKTSWPHSVYFYHYNSGASEHDKILCPNEDQVEMVSGRIAVAILFYIGGYWRLDRYVIASTIDIFQDTPSDGELSKGPTSNWAYDHAANASAHHSRYTDAEAMNARYNNKLTINTGTYTNPDVSDKGMILLNTEDGNITLKGLQGGVEGQVIVCVKTTPDNVLNIINDSGDIGVVEPFYTATGSDDNIPAGSLGIFYIISLDGYWLVSRHLNI